MFVPKSTLIDCLGVPWGQWFHKGDTNQEACASLHPVPLQILDGRVLISCPSQQAFPSIQKLNEGCRSS